MKQMLTPLILLWVILLCNPVFASFRSDSEFVEHLSLLKMAEGGSIVFVGTVMHKDYVTRSTIGITTDITMRVDTLIKGTPNLGDNHVKFMIEGGEFYSPSNNAVMVKTVSSLPEFEIGDQSLMFLSTPLPRDNGAWDYYAYGGLHPMFCEFGKKDILDDKVFFDYLHATDSPISVWMSLELATNMAKASLKDKAATILLENEIKALATGNSAAAVDLPEALATRLLTESKKIAKRKAE